MISLLHLTFYVFPLLCLVKYRLNKPSENDENYDFEKNPWSPYCKGRQRIYVITVLKKLPNLGSGSRESKQWFCFCLFLSFYGLLMALMCSLGTMDIPPSPKQKLCLYWIDWLTFHKGICAFCARNWSPEKIYMCIHIYLIFLFLSERSAFKYMTGKTMYPRHESSLSLSHLSFQNHSNILMELIFNGMKYLWIAQIYFS